MLEAPDAPAGTYTHWVLYDISGERRELPSGLPSARELPGGEIQGINCNRKTGYFSLFPPPGSTHHYILTVWALDDHLDLSGTVDADTLRKAMEGHILGTGQLTGTYRGS